MAERIKHWTVKRSRRRVAPYWEVMNGRGVLAVVYGTKADAECMASAPRVTDERDRLVAVTKRLVSALGRFGQDLTASEKAALSRAGALITELTERGN